MHLKILPGNTGEFQKSRKKFEKCNILKMRKKTTISKISIQVGQTSLYNHLNVNFIKTTLKTILSLKKLIFAFLTQKTKLFKNTAKGLPIKIHIYRQKIISILLAFGQK